MPFLDSSIVQSGRFTEIRLLGHGGSGHVYYALDTLLNRPVAIKEVLPTDRDFAKTLDKFRRESQIQALLRHPNVISVYDLEEDAETGAYYLVCEYATSGTLAAYLREHGALSEPLVLGIVLDILAALEQTWGEQIVHCDIKPANILLFEDARGKITAKLSDFGVAQDLRRRATTALPGAHHPGTPLYMAPEQWNAANTLDVRTDIYALGITLFEMLTGQDYKSSLGQADSLDMRQYNATISPDTAQVIQKALRTDRTERYQTPEEMGNDLRRIIGGDQTPRQRDTPPPSVRRLVIPPALRRAALPTLMSLAAAIAFFVLFQMPSLHSNIATPIANVSSFAPITIAATPIATASAITATVALTTTLDNYWNARQLDNIVTAAPESQHIGALGFTFDRHLGAIFVAQQPDTVPLWLYYDKDRSDYLTTTEAGKQTLEAADYAPIRIEGYIFTTQQPGTIPLWLYYGEGQQDYLTTTVYGKQRAESAGYKLVHTVGYVFPSTPPSTQTTPPASASTSISWDFGSNTDPGAVYLGICSHPDINTKTTGGCARNNVANSKVGKKGIRTQILQADTQYRVCLAADNLPARAGRWVVCKEFTAQQDTKFNFTLSDLHFLRSNP